MKKLFLVKKTCPEYYIGESRTCAPKGYKRAYAARKKDIYGEVTEDGILYRRELIYQKKECEKSYLARRDLLDDRRYPVCFYGYLNDAGCQTEHSFRSHIPSDGAEPQKKWQDIVHDYIDSLSDDDVLVGIDCHC